MTKSESSDLSPCEKTMSIMVSILKISALPVARLGAKQLGQHKHGQLLPGNGLADELPPAGQRRANLKPQMNGQPSYVMEPADVEVEDKPRTVLNQQTVDINDRADEFIRRMRKRMEQKEEVGSGDVSRKSVKPSTNYNKVAK